MKFEQNDTDTLWLFEEGTPEWKKYAIVIGHGLRDGAVAGFEILVWMMLIALIILDGFIVYRYFG